MNFVKVFFMTVGICPMLIQGTWVLEHTLKPAQAGSGVPVNDLAFGRGAVLTNLLLAGHGYLPIRQSSTVPEGSIGLWDVDSGDELQRYTKAFTGDEFNAVRSVDWDPVETNPNKFVAASSIGSLDTPAARALLFDTDGNSVADLELANVSILRSACTSAMYHPRLPVIVAAEGSGGTPDQITLWDAASTGVATTPLSTVTHTDENLDPSNPVWTARFIDEGSYENHIIVTSKEESTPFNGSVSLWNVADPINPVQAVGSPLDMEGCVNGFADPATILFTELFGTVNVLASGNDLQAAYIGHTNFINSLPMGDALTTKANIQVPVQTYSAKPIATCVLTKPAGCATVGDVMGVLYVGFTDGRIGYRTSCDPLVGDEPFVTVPGHDAGYVIGWAEAYGDGDKGYLVTVAGNPTVSPVVGEVRLWNINSDGSLTLELKITRLGTFAQIAKFEPSTNTLAIGYRDGIVEIWKLQ